ncbi:hypothetical protein GmRootA79_09880 [Acidovorax sp. A79]
MLKNGREAAHMNPLASSAGSGRKSDRLGSRGDGSARRGPGAVVPDGLYRAAPPPGAAVTRRGAVVVAQWVLGGAGRAGDAMPSASTKVSVVT